MLKTKFLFEAEGMPGFVSMILLWLDQILVLQLKGEPGNSCCKDSYLYLNRKEEKSLQTSCGKIRVNWTRLRCRACGKTFVPLKQFLKLEKHKRNANELEQIVNDVLADQSFRRTAKSIENISGTSIPHTSFHSWVMATESDEIS